MAVARQNPLAPGVYWTDTFAPVLGRGSTVARDGTKRFRQWIADNPPEVRVLREERDSSPSPIKLPGGQVIRTWFSFEVEPGVTPAAYPFRELGFPTIIKLRTAPGGVTSADRATTSADTAHNLPTTFGDIFGNFLESADFRPLVLIGLGLWVYTSLSRRRNQ